MWSHGEALITSLLALVIYADDSEHPLRQFKEVID